MTPAEARRLIDRIEATWGQLTPAAAAEWQDTLEPLDHGATGTAFVRLKAYSTRSATIADFLAIYAKVDTASQHQRIDCSTCGVDGLKHHHRDDCPDPYREDCGHNCPVGPCHCPNGDHHRDTWKRTFPAQTARPTVVADPMAAAKGRAIAERAQATERARLATFRVGVHVNDIGEAS